MNSLPCRNLLDRSRSNPYPSVPRPKPRDRQPIGRKDMTIAIGLMCNEGLIVAADTQVSAGYAGALKTVEAKIENVEGPACGALLISGAGPVGYLDSIKAKLINCFTDEPGIGTAFEAPRELTSVTEIDDRLASILDEFYTKHVLQPYERNSQHFDLLIALMRPNGIERLWTTSQTVLIPAKHRMPVAIGAGSSYALQLMASHWPYMSMAETVLFAAYVIYRVKKSVD